MQSISSTPSSIINKTPLVYRRPVSSSSSDIFAKTREEQYKKAINTKNPLSLPTFEEQGASVQAKLLRLYQNKDYQNLKPEERVAVRAKIYKDYVVPSFKAKGLQPPEIKTWLKATKSSDFNVDPKSFFESPSIRAMHDLLLGATNQAQKVALFGIKLESKTLMSMYGLGDILTGISAASPAVKQEAHEFIDANREVAKKLIKIQSASLQQGLYKTNFMVQTHPREGFLASAPRWTGEQIVQLPLYMAASSAIEASIAKKVALGTVAGPAETGLQNLTKSLATSPIGKFVGRRLYTAATMFIGSVASGDSSREATKTAIGTAGLETVAAPILNPITNRLASSALIKRWTANMLAMGGQPFASSVAETALNDATAMAEKVGTKDTEPITNTAFHGRVVEYRQPKENGFRSGYFSVNGEKYEYKTAEERLQTYDAIENRLREHRAAEDPVLHKMMEAERYTVESIALRNFGKPLSKMTPEEVNAVLKRRMELIEEATYELPAHVGDLNKMDVQEENAKDSVEHPIAGSFAAKMKAAGFPDVDEIMNESQIEEIEEQTGIKNSKNTVKRIAKVRTPKTATKEITSGAASLSPEEFLKHNNDTIAYFRNREPRRAADGTLIGKRDKRPWNIRLATENTKEFVETLKEADGDKIHFENDYHRMLFHWANRDKLPKPVREKLLREMKKIVETGPRPRYNMTAKDFNLEADWSMVHLLKLAQSGRLSSEGNVFYSSKLGGPENWTPWQKELQTEVDKKEIELLRKLTIRHPEAKKALSSSMKKVQAMRFESQSPQDWMVYNDAVHKYLSNAIDSLGKGGN